MIHPDRITNFNRAPWQLEEFLLFCVCVAGKSAHTQAERLERFLGSVAGRRGPIQKVRALLGSGQLRSALERAGIGQYRRIGAAFGELASKRFDLASVSIEDLESITGIGPKTARFFVLHSRPGQRVAVIDRHVLGFLRECGLTTLLRPPGDAKRYRELEEVFLQQADAEGRAPHELDLSVWLARRKLTKTEELTRV